MSRRHRPRLGLRVTLLVALLPMLALPWLGLRFVEQIVQLARDERAGNLGATARGLAIALDERRELFRDRALREPDPPGATPVAPEPLAAPPRHPRARMDEWTFAPRFALADARATGAPPDTLDALVSLARAQEDPGALYVLVRVTDEHWIAPGSAGEGGDRLIVETGDGSGEMQARAPIPLAQLAPADGEPPARGASSERSLVLRLAPEPRVLRLRVLDVDAPAAPIVAERDSGPIAPVRWRPPPSDAQRQQALGATLQAFGQRDGRITIYGPGGMIIARHGVVAPPPPPPARWDRRVARALIGFAAGFAWWRSDAAPDEDAPRRAAAAAVASALHGEPATASAPLPDDHGLPRWLLTIAHPIRDGDAVIGAVAVQDSTSGALDAGRALERLALTTGAALAASTLGLLLIASLTVARIVRLRDQAESAIDERGRVVALPRPSSAPDEIGDLRNSYVRVLQRLREHQDYLSALRSRLVHELRTPIMVVRSSLDNLVAEGDPARREVYAARASEGAARLERIVASMSEAGSLQTMLEHAQFEPVDLARLLSGCVEGYRSAFAKQTFELSLPAASPVVRAVPEALAQALDKLVSNALDFAQPGTPIAIALAPADAGAWTVSVRNRGPALPETAERLFDSMVSFRSATSDGVAHLGLGLYVVRLIAEAHGGSGFARDTSDGAEIGFTVSG